MWVFLPGLLRAFPLYFLFFLDSFEPLPVLGRSSSSRSWKILVELLLPLPWSLCVAWTEVRAQLIPDS